ncbi:MAG: class 1 fructose-bisphosphatase [Deltaproteobacteria bacterium]
MTRITTLDEFIIDKQKDFAYATGELSGLLRDIGVAAKIVNREVNKAGLVNILGLDGSTNLTGDEVKKLDIFANNKIIEYMENSGECCGIASEELEDFVKLPSKAGKDAKYVVVVDPLDGSSNIDVNVSVGTIFGIYRRVSDPSGECELQDFIQTGNKLVAAGYILYGTSTILVYTTGNGANGFTLDPSLGEFCLSHKDLRIPEDGSFYSINQGYYLQFDLEMRRYIDHCSDSKRSLRYIGSMVSDVHRNIIYGGIFMYPLTRKNPQGKLRILYECNPMAMVVEQCGGKAINSDLDRILDIPLKSLHQKSPIIIGSKHLVEEYEEFVKRYRHN